MAITLAEAIRPDHDDVLADPARLRAVARARAAAEGCGEGVGWARTHARRAPGGARARLSRRGRAVQGG
ncbi:MAG: hypothetical protein ACU0BS_02425, partial [Hasllibacter sp.]